MKKNKAYQKTIPTYNRALLHIPLCPSEQSAGHEDNSLHQAKVELQNKCLPHSAWVLILQSLGYLVPPTFETKENTKTVRPKKLLNLSMRWFSGRTPLANFCHTYMSITRTRYLLMRNASRNITTLSPLMLRWMSNSWRVSSRSVSSSYLIIFATKGFFVLASKQRFITEKRPLWWNKRIYFRLVQNNWLLKNSKVTEIFIVRIKTNELVVWLNIITKSRIALTSLFRAWFPKICRHFPV